MIFFSERVIIMFPRFLEANSLLQNHRNNLNLSSNNEEVPLGHVDNFERLFCLEKSNEDLLFDEAIKEGIFDSDSNFIKKIDKPLMPLGSQSTIQFLKEFKNLGIFDLFLYLNSLKDIYSLVGEKPFKIVGSYAFWISGQEYAVSVLNELGIKNNPLTDNELKKAFARPEDIDLRIHFLGASKEELRLLGEMIDIYMKLHHPDCKIYGVKREGVNKGYNCFRVITIFKNGKKIDVTLVSTLYKSFLFGEDDYYFEFSLDEIRACNAADSEKEIKLIPQGSLHQGWHAIPLRLSLSKWTDDVNAIDIPGSLRFLLSSIKGATCFSAHFEKRLFQNFLVIFSGERGGQTAIKLLREAIHKRMPGVHVAYSAFCFNLQFLLQYYSPLNGEVCSKLLFQELKETSRSDDFAIQKQLMGPIHELMKDQKIPFHVISAFLLSFGHLHEIHKQAFNYAELSQLSLKIAKTGGRNVKQLKFHQDSITLLLEADLLKSLEILKDYFMDQNLDSESIKWLDRLNSIFFPAMRLSWENLPQVKEYTEDDKIAAGQVTKIALNLLEISYLKSLGFFYLCHSGSIQGDPRYIPYLLETLCDLIITKISPSQRVTLLLCFLKYFQKVNPKNHLFSCENKIDSFCHFLSEANQKAELLKNFCKFFSLTNSPEAAQSVIKVWEHLQNQLRYMEYQGLTLDLISNFLIIDFPEYALGIFSSFLNNKQANIELLEEKFFQIYKIYSKKELTHGELIRLSNVCIQIVQKISKSRKLKDVCLKLVAQLENKYLMDEATQLLDICEKKSILFLKETAGIHLKFAGQNFVLKNYDKAFKQCELIAPVDPISSMKLILQWRKEKIAPIEKSRIFQLFLKACSSKFDNLLINEFLGAFLVDLPSFRLHHDLTSLKNSLLPQGKWLFDKLKDYLFTNEVYKHSHETIFAWWNFFEKNEPLLEDKKVCNLIATEGFLIVSSLVSDGINFDASELVKLGSELLNSFSPTMQLAGFCILCHFEQCRNDLKTFQKLSIQLASFLVSDDRSREFVFKKYFEAFDAYFPMGNSEYLNLNESLENPMVDKENLFKNFIQFYLQSNHPDTFNIVFSIWNSLANKSISLGIFLISKFLFKDTNQAVMILEGMPSTTKISREQIETVYTNLAEQVKEAQISQLLSEDQFRIFAQITQLILERSKGSFPFSFIQSLFWTIDHLLDCDFLQGKTCLEIAEKKNILNLHADQVVKFQQRICLKFYEIGDKDQAFDLMRKNIHNQNFVSILMSWKEEEKSDELYELYILAFGMNPSLELAEIIYESFSSTKHYKLESLINFDALIDTFLKASRTAVVNEILSANEVRKGKTLDLIEKYELYTLVIDFLKDQRTSAKTCEWLVPSLQVKKNLHNSSPTCLEFYFQLLIYFIDKDFLTASTCLKLLLGQSKNSFSASQRKIFYKCIAYFLKIEKFSFVKSILPRIQFHCPLAEWGNELAIIYNNLEESIKESFLLDFLDRLLDSSEGLELACKFLLNFYESESLSLNLFCQRLNRAISLFSGENAHSKIALKYLEGIIFNEGHHSHPQLMDTIDKLSLLDFYSYQESDLCAYSVQKFSGNLLDEVNEKLKSVSEEVEKRNISSVFDRILKKLKFSSLRSLSHMILSHEVIPCLYSQKKLSEHWASLLIDDFSFIQGVEHPLDVIINGVSSFAAHLSKITGSGEVEIQAIDKMIDALFAFVLVNSDYETFSFFLLQFSQQISLTISQEAREAWNSSATEVTNSFSNLAKGSLMGEAEISHEFIKRIEQYFEYSIFKFTKNSFPKSIENSSLYEIFIDRLLYNLMRYQTERHEQQCFIMANIYFYVVQACHLKLLSPDRIYSHLIDFATRYVPLTPVPFYHFHFHMVNKLFSLAQSLLGQALKPYHYFTIDLLLSNKPALKMEISQYDQQQYAFQLIMNYSKQLCQGHTNRAILAFTNCQNTLFYNSPEILEQCYSNLFEAVRSAPFLCIQDEEIELASKPIPLLHYLGLIIFQSCIHEKKSDSFVRKLANTPKMHQTMMKIISDYFLLATECHDNVKNGLEYFPENLFLAEKRFLEKYIPKNSKISSAYQPGWVQAKETRIGFSYAEGTPFDFLLFLFKKLTTFHFMENNPEKLLEILQSLIPLTFENQIQRNEYFKELLYLFIKYFHVPKLRSPFISFLNIWISRLEESNFEKESQYIKSGLFYQELLQGGPAIEHAKLEYATLEIANAFLGEFAK